MNNSTKIKKAVAVLATGCCAFAFSATMANASSVSASTHMDWSNLNVTGSVSSAGLYSRSLSGASTFTSSYHPPITVISDYDSYDMKDGIVYTSASASIPGYATADATTSPAPPPMALNAAATANAPLYQDVFSAESAAYRGQYYLVTGTGDVTFNIDYIFGPTAISTNLNEYANANSTAGIKLSFYNGAGWQTVDTFAADSGGFFDAYDGYYKSSYYAYMTDPGNSGNLSFTYSGTLNQYLFLEVGVKTGVTAENYNENAVPIPGAVWLLGSGLLGMVAIRRKTRK